MNSEDFSRRPVLKESLKSQVHYYIVVSILLKIMDIGCSNSPCLDCMESFTSKCDVSTTTVCNHVFHTECVAKWLQNDKCIFPQCKKPCTYDQFVKTFFCGLEEKSRKFKEGNGEAL